MGKTLDAEDFSHLYLARFHPRNRYPFTTITGFILATSFASPALCTTFTTFCASLYACGASSVSRPLLCTRTVTPLASNWSSNSRLLSDFLAAVRLCLRPAPWQVVPKLCSIDPCAPTSTKEYLPIS